MKLFGNFSISQIFRLYNNFLFRHSKSTETAKMRPDFTPFDREKPL